MHFDGIAIVPGVSQGALWAPAAAVDERGGTVEDFGRVRDQFLSETETMPADLAQMYGVLVLDPMWDDAVATRLADGAPLGIAIEHAAGELASHLDDLEDPYLRARAADFEQIGAHLRRLLGTLAQPPEGAILCAQNISAVELMRWAPHLAGAVLLDVAPTSHVAIVARGAGLPTVALPGTPELFEATTPSSGGRQTTAVLDGFAGWLETTPDAAFLQAHPAQHVDARPDASPVVVRGRTVGVFANVNAPDDAPLAALLGADGIGLLRTEFLYAGEAPGPSLEEERNAYARVAAAFEGRPIVVRTLDLGGDKPGAGIAEDGLDHGMLGIRGLRLTLRNPELFARHLRAIVEGFATSDLRIMFPMVTFPGEFARARDCVAAAAQAAGLTRTPPLGIMLEVPAAAYACEDFAREGAAFISLGTNDLAQYFFASSRLSLEDAIDPARSSAFRAFLRETITRAKAAGLEVGVCGEAAASADLSAFWLACGVDELSVAPSLVPWVKERLRAAPLVSPEFAFERTEA